MTETVNYPFPFVSIPPAELPLIQDEEGFCSLEFLRSQKGNLTEEDRIEDLLDLVLQREDGRKVADILSCLPARHQRVAEGRLLGKKRSLRELAMELGVTVNRISQIEQNVRLKLGQRLEHLLPAVTDAHDVQGLLNGTVNALYHGDLVRAARNMRDIIEGCGGDREIYHAFREARRLGPPEFRIVLAVISLPLSPMDPKVIERFIHSCEEKHGFKINREIVTETLVRLEQN